MNGSGEERKKEEDKLEARWNARYRPLTRSRAALSGNPFTPDALFTTIVCNEGGAEGL
jgi:hypothetical protein